MKQLAKRIADLEAASPENNRPWHVITVSQHEGETEEQAIAAYKAEHGPLGDDNVILRVFI